MQYDEDAGPRQPQGEEQAVGDDGADPLLLARADRMRGERSDGGQHALEDERHREGKPVAEATRCQRVAAEPPQHRRGHEAHHDLRELGAGQRQRQHQRGAQLIDHAAGDHRRGRLTLPHRRTGNDQPHRHPLACRWGWD